MSGLLLVYTGNGKGKTTAAIGLALRALGHNQRVGILQFMKGSKEYGEVRMAAHLPNLTLIQCGRDSFVSPDHPDPIDMMMAQDGLRQFVQWTKDDEFDLIVLDEILVALAYGLLVLPDVLKALVNRPQDMNIIVTGRYAPEEIIDLADTVTVMEEKRHAYQKGISAKAGMEY